MSLYKYIRNFWKKPKESDPELWKSRLVQYRKEPSTLRLLKPTRLDRARSLGYKAKQGIIVVRQKTGRGGHEKEHNLGGRRPKKFRYRVDLDKSYQTIAEIRANKKYPNCEVLNSYYVAHDGKCVWYEIILIDRAHPQIKADKQLNFMTTTRDRAGRGLTSSGKKSRGLRNKGKGAEKLRPSKRANIKRRKD